MWYIIDKDGELVEKLTNGELIIAIENREWEDGDTISFMT